MHLRNIIYRRRATIKKRKKKREREREPGAERGRGGGGERDSGAAKSCVMAVATSTFDFKKILSAEYYSVQYIFPRGGYKIDDVSASVIRNTFIPFVSLHQLTFCAPLRNYERNTMVCPVRRSFSRENRKVIGRVNLLCDFIKTGLMRARCESAGCRPLVTGSAARCSPHAVSTCEYYVGRRPSRCTATWSEWRARDPAGPEDRHQQQRERVYPLWHNIDNKLFRRSKERRQILFFFFVNSSTIRVALNEHDYNHLKPHWILRTGPTAVLHRRRAVLIQTARCAGDFHRRNNAFIGIPTPGRSSVVYVLIRSLRGRRVEHEIVPTRFCNR
ncbi:hypothetical protein PUN28_018148 [Cardiocondyla obscurior]|uniref:Uncharacterized protein n=1 Tax=Cardiocondyla obscurior TaxID=286306 RepID=A0AAW2EG24_9HYME